MGIKHKYLGVCGFPKSGKSELGRILVEKHGFTLVDDGRILRDACKALYDLDEADVTTQEGKARTVLVGDKGIVVRDLLGTLGNLLEFQYGQMIIAELTIARAEKRIEKPSLIVLPSVRKRQGEAIHKVGGKIVELVRSGCKANYDFDHYDGSLVDYTVINDGTVTDLEHKADQVVHLLRAS